MLSAPHLPHISNTENRQPTTPNYREFDLLQKVLQDARNEDLRQQLAKEEAVRQYVLACRELEENIALGLQILLEAPSDSIDVPREKLKKEVLKAMSGYLKTCNPKIKEKKKKKGNE